ncbi:phosphatase PAP2 family protein [Companilactobacillus baiquanensis]|uniref:Phosphatase PAP2 family protein n=1 Tax=Companilactobacillus baiquanensis TaxID=2486005 RepID=A0ABW1UVN0_9LACO|nr:phosphatase PAP2 family protein [Companilactobacillus baiquanensis]
MNSVDISLFRSINNLTDIKFFDPIGIFLAKYSIYVLAVFLIFKWFQKRDNTQYRIYLIISILTALSSEMFGKLLAGRMYYHTQPFTVLNNVHQLIPKTIGNSYPSDHTIIFFSFMIILFFCTKTWSRYNYLLIAILVSLSRVFVGVHYPSDIFFGMLIALIIGSIWYKLLAKSQFMSKLVDFYAQLEKEFFNKLGFE